MNWSTVFEVGLGAVLAFIFGGFLQWRLLIRQERFEERMESKRAAEDDKADKMRLETEQKIAAMHREAWRQIAMENRNFESSQRSQDRSDARRRQM